jgi:hypothetical protein
LVAEWFAIVLLFLGCKDRGMKQKESNGTKGFFKFPEIKSPCLRLYRQLPVNMVINAEH